ncbi:putative integral membrane protein [Brugia pahangi]
MRYIISVNKAAFFYFSDKLSVISLHRGWNLLAEQKQLALLMTATSDRCCCGLLHIKHGTITIGACSLLSTLINGLLFWFDINRMSHHFCIEFCLVLIDVFSVISLFYGILHMRPNFLKPYVYFTLAWCVALVLLFILSLVELINGGQLSVNIAISVAEIFNLAQFGNILRNSSELLTIFSLIGLLLSIALNIWFLCVIFEYYQWLTIQTTKLHFNNHSLAPRL